MVKISSLEVFFLIAVSILTKHYFGTSYGSQEDETHPSQSGPIWHGSL